MLFIKNKKCQRVITRWHFVSKYKIFELIGQNKIRESISLLKKHINSNEKFQIEDDEWDFYNELTQYVEDQSVLPVTSKYNMSL